MKLKQTLTKTFKSEKRANEIINKYKTKYQKFNTYSNSVIYADSLPSPGAKRDNRQSL